MSSRILKNLHVGEKINKYKQKLWGRPAQTIPVMDRNPLMFTSMVNTKGLSNNAGENNCFLNSAVQILWHLDAFRKNFHMLSHHTCVENSCIFCALKVIFTQFQFSEEKVLPPDALRQALAEAFADQQRFQIGLMDDAAECFEHILTRIHYHLSNGDTGDSCALGHCIPHQKFAMTIIEQVTCDCGETSEPLPFVQLIHYITAHSVIVRSLSEESNDGTRFGQTLRLAHSDGHLQNECPSKCGGQPTMKRTLTNVPDVVSIGVSWDSAEQSAEQVKSFVEAIGTNLHLTDLFDGVVDLERAKASEHKLVGVVCYYGKHYSTFFLHSKSANWMYCDDARVTDMGPNWSDVVAKCYKGRYQPLLLLYQNPHVTPISITSAPKTTIYIRSPQDTEDQEDEEEDVQSNTKVQNKSNNSIRTISGRRAVPSIREDDISFANCNINNNSEFSTSGTNIVCGPNLIPNAPTLTPTNVAEKISINQQKPVLTPAEPRRADSSAADGWFRPTNAYGVAGNSGSVSQVDSRLLGIGYNTLGESGDARFHARPDAIPNRGMPIAGQVINYQPRVETNRSDWLQQGAGNTLPYRQTGVNLDHTSGYASTVPRNISYGSVRQQDPPKEYFTAGLVQPSSQMYQQSGTVPVMPGSYNTNPGLRPLPHFNAPGAHLNITPVPYYSTAGPVQAAVQDKAGNQYMPHVNVMPMPYYSTTGPVQTAVQGKAGNQSHYMPHVNITPMPYSSAVGPIQAVVQDRAGNQSDYIAAERKSENTPTTRFDHDLTLMAPEVNLLEWSIIDPNSLLSSPEAAHSRRSSGSDSSLLYDNLVDFGALNIDDKQSSQAVNNMMFSANAASPLARNTSLTESYYIVPEAKYLENIGNEDPMKELVADADDLMVQSRIKEESGDLQAAVICCNQAASLYATCKQSSNMKDAVDEKHLKAVNKSKLLSYQIEINQQKSKVDPKSKPDATYGVASYSGMRQMTDGQSSIPHDRDLISLENPSARHGPPPKFQALKENLPYLYNQHNQRIATHNLHLK